LTTTIEDVVWGWGKQTTGFGAIDFDDPGAEVGKDHPSEGRRSYSGEFGDDNAIEWTPHQLSLISTESMKT
jgi:hypothetical protein